MRLRRLWAALGVAIVAAHAAGFAALAHHSAGTDLEVDLRAPMSLEGTVPAAIADRVEIEPIAAGPGLVRRHWRTHYRGGFTREVGASELVGPFQDPAKPACSGRVVIGERLLAPVAAQMTKMVDGELHGESIFPVGDFVRIESLALHWARLDAHPGDRGLVGVAPHGYVRATATVVFSRVSVPLVVAFVPERAGDSLKFRIEADAQLTFGNRVVQWASDKLGAARLATRIAREQIDDALITTLAPPPPFELPDGQVLRFAYCDGPIEIADDAWGALPFAVVIASDTNGVLPPRFPTGPLPAPDRDVALALDLDVNALDAMLYELWRTGWLDRRLADAALDRKFNTEPIVTEYLAIRLAPLHLALPPVIEPDRDGLRLTADARVPISDGPEVTTGRVWGAARFRFDRAAGAALPIHVALGGLELACERTPTALVPCYADLVAALRDRAPDFDGALTDQFAQLLSQIFVERELTTAGVPGSLLIHGVTPSIDGGVLHLDLDAQLR